jgi:hypothetical protein
MVFTAPEWEAYCDSLLPLSVEMAIAKEQKLERPNWIGWNDIVEAMTGILLEKGFSRISPIKAGYFGSCILDDDDDMEKFSKELKLKLIAHNQQVRDRLHSKDETDDVLGNEDATAGE